MTAKPLPEEILNKPKNSLGYSVGFSTARVRPVTGREWVYTATPDQMKTLLKVERMFGTLQAKNHTYVLMELHDDDFDGYALTVRHCPTGHSASRKYRGFPGSASNVFQELCRLQDECDEKAANV